MGNVLIVDDSRTSRKMLRQIIEETGNTVVAEAVNGEEGVTLFDLLRPDLVTMDVTMPSMDGLEALSRIMEIDSTARVVMITAAGQSAKVKDAVKLGAAEFIVKPYEAEAVVSVLRHLLP